MRTIPTFTTIEGRVRLSHPYPMVQTDPIPQVFFITNDFSSAATNYTKSSTLDPTFVFSHIQLAVAQYKLGNLANSMATFRRTMTSFPSRGEVCNY